MPESLNQSLFAKIASNNGVLTVQLIGPTIGQREVSIITDLVVPEIEQFSQTGGRWMVLDFSPITFINSMGLGMCIEFRNRVTKAGGKVALLGLNAQLLELFKMVKVDRLYTVVKDRNELAKLIAQ